jgi:hypothetical protein
LPKATLVVLEAMVGISAAPPTPLNVTVCGLPGALFVIVRIAGVLVPNALGVKVIWIEQLLPTATAIVQVFELIRKSVPVVSVTLLTVSGPVPLLATITILVGLVFSGTLPNDTAVPERGVRVTAGATPTPDNDTVWVAGDALSLIVNTPFTGPALVGVKKTEMVQALPPAMVAGRPPQLFVSVNGAVTLIELTFSGALPVFDNMTGWEGVVPTDTFTNARLPGEGDAAGVPPVAVPVSVMVNGATCPTWSDVMLSVADLLPAVTG